MVSQRDKPPEIKQGLSNKEQHLEILQTFLKTTYRTRPASPRDKATQINKAAIEIALLLGRIYSDKRNWDQNNS
jgi:hypothetical protein